MVYGESEKSLGIGYYEMLKFCIVRCVEVHLKICKFSKS